jgi:hypothetical protein
MDFWMKQPMDEKVRNDWMLILPSLLDRNGTVILQYNHARSNNLNLERILSNYLVKEYF